MKSLVMSMFLFTNAISNALAQAFTALSDDPLLVWNYGSVAIIAFVVGILFWISHRKLDKEEDRLNMLPQGHLQNRATVDIEVEDKSLGYPTARSHEIRRSREIRGSHEIIDEKGASEPGPHPATEIRQDEIIRAA
jgi:hypothetical protein